MTDSTTDPSHSFTDLSDDGLEYAGFWRRFGSLLIDGLLFIPVMMLIAVVLGPDRPAALLIFTVFFAIIVQGYITMFHALFGATLGKMATGIQLRQLNLEEIGWSEALKRNSIDYLFTLGTIASTAIFLLSIPSDDVLALSVEEFAGFALHRSSLLDSTINLVSFFWTASEVIVLLFNEKKRAIHDFIAGTVVVVKQTLPRRLASA